MQGVMGGKTFYTKQRCGKNQLSGVGYEIKRKPKKDGGVPGAVLKKKKGVYGGDFAMVNSKENPTHSVV